MTRPKMNASRWGTGVRGVANLGLLGLVSSTLVSCDPDSPGGDSGFLFEATVDCRAMNWDVTAYSNEGLPTGQQGITPVPLAGELTASETETPAWAFDRRCYYSIPGNPSVGRSYIPWDIDGPALTTGAKFDIRYRGDLWHFGGGELVIDEVSDEAYGYPGAKVRGHYNGEFWAKDRGWARIKGDFDWCDPLRHGDCPHTPDRSAQQQWSYSVPWTDSFGTASECRMVVDAATGGMQVDMQIGSWLDADITQIYALICGWTGSIVTTNRFTFKTGDVTGPGSYGPFVVTDLVGDNVGTDFYPNLYWYLPLTLSYIFDNDTSVCGNGAVLGPAIAADPGTQCSFVVQEDRFEMDCDSVTYVGAYVGGLSQPSGPFHFESECSLITID